mgnify:FL=1|jgi:hypothetical protein
MSNYQPGQQITRKQAKEDLKEDFARIGHAYTDIYVNILRIVGVSDRDTSQDYGRAFMGVATLIGAVVQLGLILG